VLLLSKKKQDWENLKIDDLAPYDIRYKLLNSPKRDNKELKEMFEKMQGLLA
jgi:hypothetical protein